MKDYYKILELEKSASSKDIRNAYIRLIRKYHPDKNPNNQKALKKYQDVVEAYNTLGDLDNRLKYSILLNKKILMNKKDELD